ncbi:hypothetical protein SUGI_0535790 [Cryptomeria japonica]|nr:hypothetical protein SUGI_0535790 [Cryptomeria japonica]
MIKEHLRTIKSYEIEHVYREGNQGANYLANLGVGENDDPIYFCQASATKDIIGQLVLEVVLLPLVDIIDSRERAIELLAGFIKPFIADSIANVIVSLEEVVKVSILKVYFQFDNYLPSKTEDDHEEEDSEDSVVDDVFVDSDTIREMARREFGRRNVSY